MSPSILRTARLTLREFEFDDAPFVHELVNEPAWLRFIGDKGVRSFDDARAYLRDGPLASYARHGFGLWRIELSDDGTPIGTCGLLRRESLPDVDIGFACLARHTGRGYMREAAAATLEYAFGELHLARVVAITDRDNVRSRHLLETIGMHFERDIQLKANEEPLALYAVDRAQRPLG